MEFNLSAGSAAVVMTSVAFVWGVIVKIFPKKETPEVIKSFMQSIQNIMERQNETLDKHGNILIQMKQTTDGSHDKLNIVVPSVLRIHDIERKVDQVVTATSKD